MRNAVYAYELEQDEELKSRVFDETQKDLRDAILQIKNSLDMEISNQYGCSNTGAADDDGVLRMRGDTMKAALLACEKLVFTTPNDKPGAPPDAFEQCMDRKDAAGDPLIPLSDARQSLFELRSQVIALHGIYLEAKNNYEQIQLSNQRSARVKDWLVAFRRHADRVGGVGLTVDLYSQPCSKLILRSCHRNSSVPCAAGADRSSSSRPRPARSRPRPTSRWRTRTTPKRCRACSSNRRSYISLRYRRSRVSGPKSSSSRASWGTWTMSSTRQSASAPIWNSPRGTTPATASSATRSGWSWRSSMTKRASSPTWRPAAPNTSTRAGCRRTGASASRTSTAPAPPPTCITFLNALRQVTNNLATGQTSSALNTTNLKISVAQDILGLTDEALAREGFKTPGAIRVEREKRFRQWVAEHTVPNNFESPYDGKPVLNFSFSTSLLDGGVFSRLMPQGYDRYWIVKVGGIGEPKAGSTGLSLNLVTKQPRLSYQIASITQAGMTHLKAQSGCIFDYKLVAPAFMLGLDWPSNQDAHEVEAVLNANVNDQHAYAEEGFRTPAFMGRPASASEWRVLVFTGSPTRTRDTEGALWQTPDMQLWQLTDIELNMSVTYASRTPGEPTLAQCTRIDY